MAQTTTDLMIVGEVHSAQYNTYVTTPVFNLDKIKLNEKIITELGNQIEKFHIASRAFNQAEIHRELDTIESTERNKLLKLKYGVTDSEIAIRKILPKIFPKIHYCGYNLMDGIGLTLFFFDNTTINIQFEKDKKKSPLTIIYIKNDIPHLTTGSYFAGDTTEINYYTNGNIKSIFSNKYRESLNEFCGFYGLYKENGSIIKETIMDKELKLSFKNMLPYYDSDEGYKCLNRIVNHYECQGEYVVSVDPVIQRLYDTNYGNLWIINYGRVKIIDNNKPYKEAFNDQMKSLENCVKIIKDETGEVLVEEILDYCYVGRIPTEGKKYTILNGSYYYLEDDKEKEVKVMAKEQNRIIIALKTLPFSPNNFDK